MRRVLLLPLLVLPLAVLTACDDDDAPSASPTPEVTAPVTAPAATSTPDAEAAIAIEAPAADEEVTVPFIAAGTANVFEGALQVDVLGNAAGLVLCNRPVQATSGTGTPGTWETTIAFNPPDTASPITLRAYTLSAEDGSPQDVVDRSLIVSAEEPNIVIEEPACNAEVPSGAVIAVSGNALVFEAVLRVQLREYFSGTVVLDQQAMAANGTERSPWSTTLALGNTPPGLYELVALNSSARDGSPENVFAIPITVVP